MCESVDALVATYLVCMSEVRQRAVSRRLLEIRIVWTLLKMFCLFVCHNDWQLGSFSTKNTPMDLDTIRNGSIYSNRSRIPNSSRTWSSAIEIVATLE